MEIKTYAKQQWNSHSILSQQFRVQRDELRSISVVLLYYKTKYISK